MSALQGFPGFFMFNIKPIDIDRCAQMSELHGTAFESGWSTSEFQAHVKNDFDSVLGCFHQDQLQGFIVVRTQGDQSEILTVVVRQSLRGQGVGTKLLSAAEQDAKLRSADIIFLEVAADNPPAQALYRRNGYQKCGTRAGYYRREKGRVDALLFQKHL